MIYFSVCNLWEQTEGKKIRQNNFIEILLMLKKKFSQKEKVIYENNLKKLFGLQMKG